MPDDRPFTQSQVSSEAGSSSAPCIPLVVLGPDYQVRAGSPSCREVFGQDPASVPDFTAHMEKILSFPGLKEALIDILGSGHPYFGQCLHENGRWYSLRIQPVTLEQESEGLLISLLDLEWFKDEPPPAGLSGSVADCIRHPVLVLDNSLQIVSANHSFYHLLQINPAGVRGRPLDKLLPDMARLFDLLRESFRSGRSFQNFETEISLPLAGKYTFLANGRFPEARSTGKPEIILTLEDISARKHLEDLLDGQARRMAEDEDSGDMAAFASLAAHDLKEPLVVASIYAELLLEKHREQFDEESRHYAQAIMDMMRKMVSLIDDVLNFCRMDLDGDFVEADAGRALDSALERLRPEIEKNKAVLRYGGLPRVTGKERLLEQLFEQLVSNSLKFRSEAAPEIFVSAERDGRWWRFSVKDNGIGVDMSCAEKIFKVFGRLHNKTAYPGSGLGLSIARKIVEHHGGTIRVESESDRGATFIFTLPA